VNLLLDTHTFLWLDGNAGKLSTTALDRLTDPRARLLLSVATIWELAIKVSLGKLTLRVDLETIVTEQTLGNQLELVPITAAHAFAVKSLPSHHKDPFDRMLIAQAIAENAILLTSDPVIRLYPVRTDW
jgi:PIN domain nuclease of toxin-antitoxin system